MKAPKRRFNRPPASHPVLMAVQRSRTPSDAELRALRIKELEAIDALAAGTADMRHARTVKLMAAMALEMARAGIGPEAEVLAEAFMRGRLYTVPGGLMAEPGLSDVMRVLFDLHDQQRSAANRAEYAQALQSVARHVA